MGNKPSIQINPFSLRICEFLSKNLPLEVSKCHHEAHETCKYDCGMGHMLCSHSS